MMMTMVICYCAHYWENHTNSKYVMQCFPQVDPRASPRKMPHNLTYYGLIFIPINIDWCSFQYENSAEFGNNVQK